MDIVVRWVHPRKVDKDGSLKPAAFRTADVNNALNKSCGGKCSKNAISLADFSLLTKENELLAKQAACNFCQMPGDKRKQKWDAGENCDCEDGLIGARGAFVGQDEVIALFRDKYGIEAILQSDVNPHNPLHTLLCFCRQDPIENSYQYDTDEIQKELLRLFSSIKNVQDLFNSKG